MTRVFCAIDTMDLSRAVYLAQAVSEAGCGIKLGLEFFSALGASGVHSIRNACPDIPVFMDMKFHDIPNTVAQSLRAVTRLEPQIINVHATGGAEMMRSGLEAVRDEAARLDIETPKLLAVTVLTSLTDTLLEETGQGHSTTAQVVRLARLTQNSGLDGVVCSGHEIALLREECGKEFILLVPGIRPAGAETGDQKRVVTPEDAIQRGATYLVIGRPITGAEDPARAAADILAALPKAA